MLFTSPEFLFGFLPLVYIGFLVLSGKGGHRLIVQWLLIASMAFYAWWSPRFLIFLIVSMCANYFAGRLIERSHGRRRFAITAAAIAANLCVLAYFKYFNFFLSVAADAGLIQRVTIDIVLPLGISFFTFQKIAYLADIQKGLARSAGFFDFALFVFFFPQLIAGPIVHPAEVMPQYRRLGAYAGSLAHHAEDAAVGFSFIIIGLFKKVVVADQIARAASPVYAAASGEATIGALLAWQAALCYTAQLYFDFSGYSDMAIGLARLFGVTFPPNFNSPYRATSMIDFWRRWHMTLSRFLRDYVYIPLGGNRHGPMRRYVNIFITMLIGGLWHGAGWTFVFWGGLHGVYLLINHLWRDHAKIALPAPLGYFLTMSGVVVAWVFFRSPDMASAWTILRGMAFFEGWSSPGLPLLEAPGALFAALGLLAACIALPNSQTLLERYAPVLGPAPQRYKGQIKLLWRPSAIWGVVLGVMATTALLLSWDQSEFLYFNF